MPASVPPNVSVKPPFPAPAEVTPVEPSNALIWAVTFAFETARPPSPKTADVLPFASIWNDCVVALKPVSTACCCSFPPWSAFWIPAVVLFWPRTIGTVSTPLYSSVYESVPS